MPEIASIRDLVNLWPTRAELARDVAAVAPDICLSVAQVHKWAEKQSIPARYHHPVLRAAQRRGFAVTADRIAELHAPVARDRGAA